MSQSANNIGVLANFLTPRGFEKLDLSSGIQSLTPPDIGAVQMIALIQSVGGKTRYRDDGVPPTDSIGFALFETQSLQYNVLDLNLISFIADATTPATFINVVYYSFATLGEVPNPVNPFCGLLSLVNFITSGTPTVTITGNAVNMVNTGGGTARTHQVGTESFISSTDVVPIENTFVNMPQGTTNFTAISFWDGPDPTTATKLCSIDCINVGTGTTTLNDGRTAIPLIPGFNALDGYTYGIAFDTAAGTARFKDSVGNDTTLSVDSGFNNANPIFMGIETRTGNTINDEVNVDFNAGTKAFIINFSGDDTLYCKV